MTRHHRRARARQRGVTLIELLVALGIFALIGSASIGVLSLALAGRDQLDAATDEARTLERARSLMRADLMQIAPRPVREEEGAAPAFAGGPALADRRPGDTRVAADETVLLSLTRTGWDDPSNLRPRPELQRVTYLTREGELIRRTRPYLDAAPDTPSQDQVLLSDLTDVSVGFHDGDAWRDGAEDAELPQAVRIAFDHPTLGPVRNDFLAGPR